MIDAYLSAFLALAVVFVPLGLAALIMEIRARQSHGPQRNGRRMASSISKSGHA
ncbi:MAG TPA: hypothetical protein VMT94_06190 [Burkholderiales bacterium]|nr:hypothetical protein [Burkholderiales bacterium]